MDMQAENELLAQLNEIQDNITLIDQRLTLQGKRIDLLLTLMTTQNHLLDQLTTPEYVWAARGEAWDTVAFQLEKIGISFKEH